MKKLLALCLLTLMCTAQAGEKEIRKSLQEKFPGIGGLTHIKKSEVQGLYEVVLEDGQLVYVESNGKYLIDGNMIDLVSRKNISEERRRILFAIDFDKLPLDLAVKKVKGNGKRKMAYFTDPNCTYCKKLEQELVNVTDVTLYIFLYPIFNGSDEIVRNVTCSKNPIKSWDDLMLNEKSPEAANCDTPTAKVKELGQKHRVNGTPNLIFANGQQVPGYMPAAELEKQLNTPAQNK